MLNIVKANSPSKKLPDGHPLTLLCKILNVNFLKPQCRPYTPSFRTLRVLGTKLRAVSISYGALVCAAVASMKTMPSERH